MPIRMWVFRSYASLLRSSFVVLNGLVVEHFHSLLPCQWMPTIRSVTDEFQFLVDFLPFLFEPVLNIRTFEVLTPQRVCLLQFVLVHVAVDADSSARLGWRAVVRFPLHLD